MKYVISTLLIFAIIGTGCSDDITHQTLTKQTIDLDLLKSGKVSLQGEIMSIADLSNRIEDIKGIKDKTVDLTIAKNATMGQVTDIQEILRDKGALKVKYSSLN